MNESKFNMWRACLAAVHIDKKVTIAERKWVEEKMVKLPLSLDQKKQLAMDLEKGIDFKESFKKITVKSDLAFVLNTLRVISYLDKDFSNEEKKSFQELEEIILKGIDLNLIKNELNALDAQFYSKK